MAGDGCKEELSGEEMARILYAPRIYIAGPMRGIPFFNFPAFHNAEAMLREEGWVVFSPAARDIERAGYDISESNTEGSIEQAEESDGFDLRVAMAEDLDWICRNADAIYMLYGWEKSPGATAEWALARALDLEIYYDV